ncbi:hypothetical protein, partial [Kitasatospora sp. NE20-6]|uniref:hypothetical protein n=1 Tax=Kitasatospora sp. NE20-6 TaxID=2859066 RepID=UPI0038B2C273
MTSIPRPPLSYAAPRPLLALQTRCCRRVRVAPWPTAAAPDEASAQTPDDTGDLPQRHRRPRTERTRGDAPVIESRELNPEEARDTWSQ